MVESVSDQTTDIRYQQYAGEDLIEGCMLHPNDLKEAISSFKQLFALHTSSGISGAPTQWSVAVDAELLDIEYATIWVKLIVSRINGHSSVPVVIFSS